MKLKDGRYALVANLMDYRRVKDAYRVSAGRYIPWMQPYDMLDELPALTPEEASREATQPVPWKEKQMRSMKPGQCICCRKKIEVGQLIYWAPWSPSGTARHAGCEVTPEYLSLIDKGEALEYLVYVEQAIAVIAQRPDFLNVYGPDLEKVMAPYLHPETYAYPFDFTAN